MKLFFRNDDLGWNPREFSQLLDLFVQNGHKLNVAAIPMACLETYEPGSFANTAPYLQIHSHGLAHFDHAEFGKKCEFGDNRTRESVAQDLQKSKAIAEELFGELYYPAFTPPWNRISDQFIPLLKEAGFEVLSRDGDKNASFPGLQELNIDVDLHTCKVPVQLTPEELVERIQSGDRKTLGIMLHHKHMARKDYDDLDRLLKILNEREIPSHFFSEMSAHAI